MTATGPGGFLMRVLKAIGNVALGIVLVAMLYVYAVIFLCL